MIAEDFSKVMFSYHDQNYLCEEKNGIFCQRELSFLTKRKVKSLRTDGGEIFIFSCKEYDQDLDVYCTSWLKSQPKLSLKKTKTSIRNKNEAEDNEQNLKPNTHFVMKINRQIT